MQKGAQIFQRIHPKVERPVERPGSSSDTSMMEKKKMITMIVDTLPVFYYEKMVGYAPSKLCGFGLRQ